MFYVNRSTVVFCRGTLYDGSMQVRPPYSPILGATLWMTGALTSFMAMAISGRELSGELSTFEILFFRSLIGLVVICIVLTRSGWGQIRTHLPLLHVSRNLCHFVGQFGWFYGIAFIPLAQVFAIEFTVPIWVAVIAPVFLGEKMTRSRLITIAIGFAGILVLLRPGVIPINLAILAVFMAAMGFALSHTMTKMLTRTDTPLSILFYMTAVQIPLGLVPALFDWVNPAPGLWPWLFGVGVTALSAHYCMSRAFQLADALVVIPIDFLRLPLIALVGFLFYQEALDVFVLLGALIIVGGNFYGVTREARRKTVQS